MANNRLDWNVDLERQAVEMAILKVSTWRLRDIYFCFVENVGVRLYVECEDADFPGVWFYWAAPSLNAILRHISQAAGVD